MTAGFARFHAFARRLSPLVHVAVATLVAGCTSPLGPEPGTTYDVTIDGAFTEAERVQLVGCASDWHAFSHARVSIRFVDEAGGDLALERRGPAPGGYTKRLRVAWIDAESMYADGFNERAGVRAMCMNLVGQFFGVALHGARGALSREDVVPYWTDEDRAACRAAGLCD